MTAAHPVLAVATRPCSSQRPRRAQNPPELTAPVNDFAGVIGPEVEQQLEDLIRRLQAASGDVIVVATVETFQPYGDIPNTR